ncbi:MAG TPA: hypothetical protein VI583_14145 [Cyclobacteriaceae bacterium]|nr:hypothetical protein [Cyclobacteriaceae bacterium]
MSVPHRFYIFIYILIVLLACIVPVYYGLSFYSAALEERFYHADYAILKPSGIWGHGYGIIGSLFMVIGVAVYSTRKRIRSFSQVGILKHWLEFHIFLCTMGPVLVLFHTSFKFGGLVAISFWSMVAVFLSGIAGRFIYIQIPRSIEGKELSLNEVRALKMNISDILNESHKLDEASINVITESTRKKIDIYRKNMVLSWFRNYFNDRKTIQKIRLVLKKNNIPGKEYKNLIRVIKQDITLNRKIERLESMQNLFKYWHVAHLPFALVMLVIMVIHVIVTIVFGYQWIF